MKTTDIDRRIEELSQMINRNPHDETLWTERGSLYWKKQDWSRCIADFDQAIALNPHGVATELRRSAMQVITYYYKDRYNP